MRLGAGAESAAGSTAGSTAAACASAQTLQHGRPGGRAGYVLGTPLFKGFVSDEAACALLCEAHALCNFYSAFSTGWCRLTESCGLAEVDSDGDGIPDSSDPDSTVDWVNVKSCGAPPSAPMPPLAPLL